MYDTANAPPEVAAMKTMLEASATWAALTGTICYPSASTGDSASPTTPPYIVIEPSEDAPHAIAPAIVLPEGKIQLLLTMLSDSGSSIEKTARAIANEIMAQAVGLPVTGARTGMCSEPDAASRAAQSYSDGNTLGQYNALRTIPIIVSYGIS